MEAPVADPAKQANINNMVKAMRNLNAGIQYFRTRMNPSRAQKWELIWCMERREKLAKKLRSLLVECNCLTEEAKEFLRWATFFSTIFYRVQVLTARHIDPDLTFSGITIRF